MFKAEQTHSGQYRRYGDSFYEWDIETDLPESEALERCFTELNGGTKLPEKTEWHKNTGYGGSRQYDMGYYFAGYYTLIKTETGCHFTICRPFMD